MLTIDQQQALNTKKHIFVEKPFCQNFKQYKFIKGFKGGSLDFYSSKRNNESLSNWKKLGINRLSIGVQSFIDNKLKWMNRSHNSIEASTSILRAQDAGFENISIDLIYGIMLRSFFILVLFFNL